MALPPRHARYAAGLASSPPCPGPPSLLPRPLPPRPSAPGLHDIAAVLLFVLGSELSAYRLLRALASTQLRDCTRPNLGAATETLRLLYPILEQVVHLANRGF